MEPSSVTKNKDGTATKVWLLDKSGKRVIDEKDAKTGVVHIYDKEGELVREAMLTF